MNPRRIVRTLIVVLVTIVGRWLIRAPLTPMPEPAPIPPHPPIEPPQPGVPSGPGWSPEAVETPHASHPLAYAHETSHASATDVAVLETPIAVLETYGAVFKAPVAMHETSAADSETTVDVPDAPSDVHETPATMLEAPASVHETPTTALEAPASELESRVAALEAPDLAFEAPTAMSATPIPSPEPPLDPSGTGASHTGAWSRDWQLPEREHADVAVEAAASTMPPVTYANGTAPPLEPASRRMRRRSEATERPSRLLGGAGFLLAAIACFVASFVLFVRLTTPDRAAPAVYAVVPYVAASERDVQPALASFAGDIDTSDSWLVLRLPVAARYVALTGLRTVDRWTTNRFALTGPKPTLGANAASCYSGAGVANGPPELTPLPEGSIVRDESTASLSPERLVRVDVGALLADATSTKTLVCAIAPPARVGFASYAATIGVPNVPASDVTGSRVKLSALPLAVDYSAFGNASAMRFTQTSLAVATDPLHATLDVAGFETFAYDDPDGDARRDVLLFIAGALATIGAVATADALRPWLGIERR